MSVDEKLLLAETTSNDDVSSMVAVESVSNATHELESTEVVGSDVDSGTVNESPAELLASVTEPASEASPPELPVTESAREILPVSEVDSDADTGATDHVDLSLPTDNGSSVQEADEQQLPEESEDVDQSVETVQQNADSLESSHVEHRPEATGMTNNVRDQLRKAEDEEVKDVISLSATDDSCTSDFNNTKVSTSEASDEIKTDDDEVDTPASVVTAAGVEQQCAETIPAVVKLPPTSVPGKLRPRQADKSAEKSSIAPIKATYRPIQMPPEMSVIENKDKSDDPDDVSEPGLHFL